MYQFLYEANAWKFLWSRAFGIDPSAYYVLTSQVFGADHEKLVSVDFSSAANILKNARRAIDGVYHLETADDIINWCVKSISKALSIK